MLASFSSVTKEDGESVVTVELQNGRKIVGQLCSDDKIELIENTTDLRREIAECAAGIAIVNMFDLNNDVMVWRRLVDQAERCHRQINKFKWKLN